MLLMPLYISGNNEYKIPHPLFFLSQRLQTNKQKTPHRPYPHDRAFRGVKKRVCVCVPPRGRGVSLHRATARPGPGSPSAPRSPTSTGRLPRGRLSRSTLPRLEPPSQDQTRCAAAGGYQASPTAAGPAVLPPSLTRRGWPRGAGRVRQPHGPAALAAAPPPPAPRLTWGLKPPGGSGPAEEGESLVLVEEGPAG